MSAYHKAGQGVMVEGGRERGRKGELEEAW